MTIEQTKAEALVASGIAKRVVANETDFLDMGFEGFVGVTERGTKVSQITIDSLERLALQEGRFISAEIKAPWMILEKGSEEPQCSAENRFQGVIDRISQGCINTEYTVRILDGTELCSVVSTESAKRLYIERGDQVWVCFNCFAVVLNAY